MIGKSFDRFCGLVAATCLHALVSFLVLFGLCISSSSPSERVFFICIYMLPPFATERALRLFFSVQSHLLSFPLGILADSVSLRSLRLSLELSLYCLLVHISAQSLLYLKIRYAEERIPREGAISLFDTSSQHSSESGPTALIESYWEQDQQCQPCSSCLGRRQIHTKGPKYGAEGVVRLVKGVRALSL